MHAADTYSPLGNWYFVQRTALRPATFLFFAAWQMYLQAFFMGLLFFIAGYFAPASLARKGPVKFAWERAFRLGIPVLLYMFALGPILEFYLAKSWTSTGPTSFPAEWWKHIENGQVLQENGPLWFCVALLMFSLVFAWLGPRLGTKSSSSSPSNGKLMLFAASMAGCTFLVRLTRPGTVLNMHLSDFAQYILMYCAGVNAGREGWLPRVSSARGKTWLSWTVGAGFPLWLLIVFLGGGMEGRTDPYSGGWYWQSAALTVWESFTCVGVGIGLLVVFRDHFNFRGRIAGFLSDNAFAAYVFHPLLVVSVARLLFPVGGSPMLKFVVLTLASALLTFGLSALVFRRVPLLRAIL